MTKTKGLLLTAGLVLATAFTFSCSGDGGDGGSSSSGGGGSSSSGDGTQGGVVYGDPVPYGGETYQTVVIGTQIWFARNLNYDVPNVATDKCYGNDDNNCAIYGRLYDWATAMNIDARYNNSRWNGSDANHRGICPSGWRLPSDDDWDKLFLYVDGQNGGNGSDWSETAGKYLKATSDWNDWKGSSGNGTDNYGFSALPGGSYDIWEIDFYGIGDIGNWWSSSESDWTDTAFYLHMSNYVEPYLSNGDGGDNSKSGLLSVRCVKDN